MNRASPSSNYIYAGTTRLGYKSESLAMHRHGKIRPRAIGRNVAARMKRPRWPSSPASSSDRVNGCQVSVLDRIDVLYFM